MPIDGQQCLVVLVYGIKQWDIVGQTIRTSFLVRHNYGIFSSCITITQASSLVSNIAMASPVATLASPLARLACYSRKTTGKIGFNI